MKRLLILAFCLASTISLMAQSYNHLEARKTSEWFRESVSYQLVVRNFSEEGTLKGAEKGLKRLKDLGVGVIYLIPVCESDTDMDRKGWSPKQIRAGFNDPRNPYRISDYLHVDPEYGTDQDLKDFINTAHKLGMSVNVWTVNKEEDMKFFYDLGVDQITTDNPLIARQVLEQNGIKENRKK